MCSFAISRPWHNYRSNSTMKKFIKLPILSIPPFSLSSISRWVVKSIQLEMPDREKIGIERKGNFIIDLRCYLFHCTVGHMAHSCIFGRRASRTGTRASGCRRTSLTPSSQNFLILYWISEWFARVRMCIHLASEKYWPIDMHEWNGHNFLDKLHIQVTVWA